jgi:hypothetical protein
MAEATIGALANLATATASYRGVVAALTQANAHIVKQLEETSSELRELKAMVHQERRDRRGPINVNATANKYCWTHVYKVGRTPQASPAPLATLATKRRQLGLKTWEVVRPTRNVVSGRQL